MKHKVLLIMLDENLSRSVKSALEKTGYEVFTALDRYRAITLMNEKNPEFLVLDKEIPDSDVIMLFRNFRWEMKLSATSILLLTDNPSVTDRFLDIRADGYLVKPFEIEVMIEKLVSMVHGQSTGKAKITLKTGNIEMQREKWMVYVEGGPVNLTEKEYRLLQELMEANGRVLTRETLLERVWGHKRADNVESRTLDVHMSRLRNKLGTSARNIVTVRNVGYRMSVYPD